MKPRQGGRERLFAGLAAILLLLLYTGQASAEVHASLNRSTIQDGESVTLVIEASGEDPAGQPDLSVLERDFEVLGTSTSQQFQFINGRSSDKRTWQIELQPRGSGKIQVPAISVGNTQTRPLRLQVTDQPAAAAEGETPAVFIKTLVEPMNADVYVQQQVNYTLQLYYSKPLLNGSFDGPQIDKALVERMGEDVSFSTRIHGREYQVIERRYAVFPQESGELVIPAVTFTGQQRADSPGRLPPAGVSSMIDEFMSGMPFGRPGKRIRVRSDALSLKVKPRPQGYSGTAWLPAEDLSLHDSWADEPPEFRVGEPVTRTVRIEARGLGGSQLPALGFADVAGMRLYPEQPQRESHSDGNSVYGSSSQSLAYVPSSSGKVSIPEIRVDWWDSAAQQQRTAVLPAWEFNVLPGSAKAAAGPPPVPETPPAVAQAAPAADSPAAVPPQTDSWRTALQRYWPWLAAGLLLAVAAGLFARRLLARTHTRDAVPGRDTGNDSQTALRQRRDAALAGLQLACDAGDPRLAANALLQLAEAEWPNDPPRSLAALARRLVAGTAAVQRLERVLYAAGESGWEGQELWQLMRHGLPVGQAGTTATATGLAPLYPDWKQQRGEA